MIKLNLAIVFLGLLQIFWLYKAWRSGGFMAVLNLIGFSMIGAIGYVLQEVKEGRV